MLRIYKNYNLPYRIGGSSENATQPVPAQQITFSSYPAVPFSLDDFYQTSVELVRDIMQRCILRGTPSKPILLPGDN
jgi:hypothetical protein